MRKASSSHTMFHFLRSSFVQCQVKCGLQGGQGSRGANFKRGWRVSGSSTLPVQAFFSLMLPRDVFSLRTTLAENTEIAWLDYHTCCWSAYANAMQIWNVSNNHSCTTRTVGICHRGFNSMGTLLGWQVTRWLTLGMLETSSSMSLEQRCHSTAWHFNPCGLAVSLTGPCPDFS